ncbi:hypothetical protein [Enterobacter hormaechei]|jgi:hypothetical protein|uniref:hypothetical protein n=1 Tax=Enterobacter hormaechei TaxID=158836 RepID=UPI00298B589E|nr:hypothetical protein [Salmonella enterica]
MSGANKELADLIENSISLKELFQAIQEADGSAEVKANRFMRWLPGEMVEKFDKEDIEALFEENPLR